MSAWRPSSPRSESASATPSDASVCRSCKASILPSATSSRLISSIVNSRDVGQGIARHLAADDLLSLLLTCRTTRDVLSVYAKPVTQLRLTTSVLNGQVPISRQIRDVHTADLINLWALEAVRSWWSRNEEATRHSTITLHQPPNTAFDYTIQAMQAVDAIVKGRSPTYTVSLNLDGTFDAATRQMSDYRKRWAATILPEGVSQPSVFHVSLAWHLEERPSSTQAVVAAAPLSTEEDQAVTCNDASTFCTLCSPKGMQEEDWDKVREMCIQQAVDIVSSGSQGQFVVTFSERHRSLGRYNQNVRKLFRSVFGRISSYTEPQVRALFGDTEMEIDECARRKDAMMSSLVFVDIDFAKTGIEMMRANPGRRWHFEEAGAGYGGRPVYISEPETSPGQGGE